MNSKFIVDKTPFFILGSVEEDKTRTEAVITLSEEQFNEYMENGYFRGVKYRWSSQGDVYKVFISQSSYDKFMRNMESPGLKKWRNFS